MINTCTILGRLGRDPNNFEKDGFSSSLFSVATDNIYKKDDGEYEQQTNWVNVKALGKVSDRIKDWGKGDLVSVEGIISAESWIDKATGEKKFSQYLIAKKVKRVSKYDPSSNSDTASFTAEDIPF